MVSPIASPHTSDDKLSDFDFNDEKAQESQSNIISSDNSSPPPLISSPVTPELPHSVNDTSNNDEEINAHLYLNDAIIFVRNRKTSHLTLESMQRIGTFWIARQIDELLNKDIGTTLIRVSYLFCRKCAQYIITNAFQFLNSPPRPTKHH